MPASGTISARGNRYDGIQASELLGETVRIEDVTGDGFLDIIAHWERADAGATDTGIISVIPGNPFAPSAPITTAGRQ